MPNIEYMNKTDRVLHSIRHSLRLLVAATVVLSIVLGCVVIYTYNSASKSNDALCALRNDREKSIASSALFLAKHPNGAFGFTPAQIQKSINDQTSTIHSLSNLNC